eukprot:Em0023g646a
MVVVVVVMVVVTMVVVVVVVEITTAEEKRERGEGADRPVPPPTQGHKRSVTEPGTSALHRTTLRQLSSTPVQRAPQPQYPVAKKETTPLPTKGGGSSLMQCLYMPGAPLPLHCGQGWLNQDGGQPVVPGSSIQGNTLDTVRSLLKEMLHSLEGSMATIKATSGCANMELTSQLETAEAMQRAYVEAICMHLSSRESAGMVGGGAPGTVSAEWLLRQEEMEEEKTRLHKCLLKSETAYSETKSKLESARLKSQHQLKDPLKLELLQKAEAIKRLSARNEALELLDMYGRVPPSPQAYMDHTGLPPYAPAPPYNAPQYPGQYPYGLSKAMRWFGDDAGGHGDHDDGGLFGRQHAGPVMMGGAPPYSTSGSWSGRMSSGGGDGGVGRPWLQDPNGDGSGSPSWTSPVAPTGSRSSSSGQQQQAQPQQGPSAAANPSQPYRQLSQSSAGAMSPQAPYSADLQKHSSVSSLRDALMTSSTAGNIPSPLNPYNAMPMQQPSQAHVYPPGGPGLMNNPSPITPSVRRPHTPDASTPAGRGRLSAGEKGSGSEGSPVSSGQVTPYGGAHNFGSGEEGKESLRKAEYSIQGRCRVLCRLLLDGIILGEVAFTGAPKWCPELSQECTAFYVKVVLPYECQLKGWDMAECIQCFRVAMHYVARTGEASRLKNATSAVLGATGDSRDTFEPEKTNGDVLSSGRDQIDIHRRLSQRTSSQDSDTSGFQGEGQELTHTVSHNPPRLGGQQQQQPPGRRKQEAYEFADGASQGSVEDEPLPDIGVQEAESLLGMQYLPPMGGTGPGTPGGQNTPSPSPYTPQYQSTSRGEWPGADMVPNTDVSELGIIPGHPPPAYPPSYPMDPAAAMYRIRTQRLRHDEGGVSGGTGGPYPGMMSLGPPPGMDPASSYPQHYMMSPQQQQMAMYRHGMEMGYPGHGIPAEWQQQWRHHNRVTPIPPHMQVQYQRSSQPSTSPRPLHPQQGGPALPSSSASSTTQQQSSSPHQSDVMRAHWQEQQGQGKGASAKLPGSPSPKPKLEVQSPSSLGGSKGQPAVKSAEMQVAAIDSMRRPLPDWSVCVEGTKPQLVKRRRLFAGDCGHVEPWRVMMSLKSGILSESTWALDTLNILLHDDRTVGFFCLKHHQSLLNTLVDHFKQCLTAIFGTNLKAWGSITPTVKEKTLCCPGKAKRNGLSGYRKGAKNRPVPNGDVGKEEDEMEQAVPLTGVFNGSTDMALGRSDNLSHIEVSFASDDPLFFPESKGSPSFESECLGSRLERNRKRQRIDETPLAELLRRSIVSDHNAQLSLLRRTVRSPKKVGSGERSPQKENGHSQEEEVAGECLRQKKPVIVEESEIYQKELLPLWTIPPNKEFIQARCLCVSNILRSLSFIPGNDIEFSQHAGTLLILGRLLMLHHCHLARPMTQLHDHVQEEKPDDPVPHKNHWWWDCLDVLQENTLVILRMSLVNWISPFTQSP